MIALAKRKSAVGTGASMPVLLVLLAGAIFLVIGSVKSSIFAQQTANGPGVPFDDGRFTSRTEQALAMFVEHHSSGNTNGKKKGGR